MKNNKALIIICVVLVNVLVVFMLGQNLMGKSTQFEIKLEEAREFAQQELYARSVEKYKEAISLEDSPALRLELIEIYGKGLESGELTQVYNIFTDVQTAVDAFHKEVSIYEAAADLYLSMYKYEECAKLLMQARDLKLTSEKLTDALAQVRYKHSMVYGLYDTVFPVFDGMQTAASEGTYVFLNDEGAAELQSGYCYASSFSEGYAFVKSISPDGTEKAFLINKEGQRQVYMNEVAQCSGVGGAKNAEGERILLLACEVGGKYTYYDVSGKQAFGEYVFAGRFRNNVAAVQLGESKWQLIDGTGNPITDKIFTDVILNEFDECAPKGLIIAAEGGKYHIYDLTGTMVGTFACDYAKAFVDEYAAFKQGDVWGFVDATGQVIIEPQYQDAKSFSNRMGAILTDSGWTFISPENEIVVNAYYEDAGYLSDKGICFVKENGFWCYLKMYYTGK